MQPSPQLLQAIRESRISISKEYSGMLYEMDVARKFQHSFQHHPARWLGGAAVAGLTTALLRRKGHGRSSIPQPGSVQAPVAVKTARWVTALEIARTLYPVLKPLVSELVGVSAKTILARRK